MAQRVGGCLTVLEHEAEHQGQDEPALVVAPTATVGVGELLLLMHALCPLLVLFSQCVTGC